MSGDTRFLCFWRSDYRDKLYCVLLICVWLDNSSWLPHDNGPSDAKFISTGGFNMCGERSAKNSILRGFTESKETRWKILCSSFTSDWLTASFHHFDQRVVYADWPLCSSTTIFAERRWMVTFGVLGVWIIKWLLNWKERYSCVSVRSVTGTSKLSLS